jgi:thiosulfate dehydrogenase [quinone] large subunit
MSWPLRIMRAFLGGTFVFAGAQKLLDRNFLRAGSPDFVGTQLRGFSAGTPAGPLLHVLARFPVAAGVGIALVEIAVGLGVLFGVALLLATAVGFAVNLTLFLSATWHVHPFFLGSDSAYAVLWLAFGVGVWEIAARRSAGALPSLASLADGMDRRAFVRAGAIGAGALAVAWAARTLSGTATTDGIGVTAAGGAPAPPGTDPTLPFSPPSQSPAPTAAPAPAGRRLTSLQQLPVGKAVGFEDPVVGPAVLVRLADDRVVAYSRVCTHAGCLVGYDQSSQVLVCPCHGAQFDAAGDAQPIAGPTSTPLQAIAVEVDQQTGDVILPS